MVYMHSPVQSDARQQHQYRVYVRTYVVHVCVCVCVHRSMSTCAYTVRDGLRAHIARVRLIDSRPIELRFTVGKLTSSRGRPRATAAAVAPTDAVVVVVVVYDKLQHRLWRRRRCRHRRR